MINRPARDYFSGHLFEANRVCAQLEIVMFPFSPGTMFVFNGIGGLAVKLHDIRLPD
jgi:hypothetical protein